MNDLLGQFYGATELREAVKAFLIDELKALAVDRVFDKKAISGIYEARKVIDLSFDKLDEIYGKPKVSEPQSAR